MNDEKQMRLAEMADARQTLVNAGLIIMAGLVLIFVVLGAAGFWGPVP